MLETCRHCYTNEREHWSDRPCLVFILCSLLVTPVFLLTEPVALRCSIKRSSPKNSAKPTSTGKHSFPIKKRLRHMCSSANCAKPSRTFFQQNTSGGCFRSNIYIKNDRTATWIGKKIIYLIMWIYLGFMLFFSCPHYVYAKDFYQVLFVAYFSDFLPVSAFIFNFNFSIDCVKCINIFFLP